MTDVIARITPTPAAAVAAPILKSLVLGIRSSLGWRRFVRRRCLETPGRVKVGSRRPQESARSPSGPGEGAGWSPESSEGSGLGEVSGGDEGSGRSLGSGVGFGSAWWPLDGVGWPDTTPGPGWLARLGEGL